MGIVLNQPPLFSESYLASWLGVVNPAFMECRGCGKCNLELEGQEGILEI